MSDQPTCPPSAVVELELKTCPDPIRWSSPPRYGPRPKLPPYSAHGTLNIEVKYAPFASDPRRFPLRVSLVPSRLDPSKPSSARRSCPVLIIQSDFSTHRTPSLRHPQLFWPSLSSLRSGFNCCQSRSWTCSCSSSSRTASKASSAQARPSPAPRSQVWVERSR